MYKRNSIKVVFNLGDIITLDKIKTGEQGRVVECLIDGNLKRRILDFGIVRGAKIKCVGKSALGDPSAYLISGTVIAIRKKDAKSIVISRI